MWQLFFRRANAFAKRPLTNLFTNLYDGRARLGQLKERKRIKSIEYNVSFRINLDNYIFCIETLHRGFQENKQPFRLCPEESILRSNWSDKVNFRNWNTLTIRFGSELVTRRSSSWRLFTVKMAMKLWHRVAIFGGRCFVIEWRHKLRHDLLPSRWNGP